MKGEFKEKFDENKLDNLSKLSENIYQEIGYQEHHEIPKPSLENIKRSISLVREILFPGYYSEWKDEDEMNRELKENLFDFSKMMKSEISTALCFDCDHKNRVKCDECEKRSEEIIAYIVNEIDKTRNKLLKDVRAIYEFDPAAKSIDEVILSYPAIKALMNYRIAHTLYEKEVPLLPRIITEIAHSETGIDIHPGADIGEEFFIDHGTGVVIGETCEIGDNVKIYQVVTLGAKTFPLDKDEKPVKGFPRHPIIEDNVTIYAHATVLGRITIGEKSTIGSNVTVLEDVPSDSKIIQKLDRNDKLHQKVSKNGKDL
ncbi:MAG: serine O-acetyltransferase EpsC [Thermoplasmatota archaeon]